ncbi:MAG: heme o synthase [Spirochaetia bacterium]|jgi:protoheme IX farnesyltransferase
MKSYLQLIKPRITILILIVAMASFYLADRGSPDWKRFALMTIATGLLASGIFALNAYLERDTDRLMRRTATRPLPGNRLLPRQALAFGLIVTASALLLLSARLGWIAGVVGLFTFVSYVLIYTPLKRHTELHTAVGALSGATPPLIGWAAARGTLEPGAWILSGILFLWQFPHFLAIESMYRDDYERAGIRVLPVSEPTGAAAASLMVAAMCLLLPLSAAPFLAGLSSRFALVGCLVVGAGFLSAGVFHSLRKTPQSARIVLRSSLLYLPLVFALLVFAGPR